MMKDNNQVLMHLKSNVFFILFCTLYVFGIFSQEIINTRLLDENIALILFITSTIFLIKKQEKPQTSFLVTIIVFTVFTLHSFLIKSNTFIGIISDAVIQFKPYIGFFCVLIIAPTLKTYQQKILLYISMASFFYATYAAVFSGGVITDNYEKIYQLIGHPCRFAYLISSSALLFILFSKTNKTNIFIFFVILSIGLISGRSKFYAFYFFCIFIWIYSQHKPIKIKKSDWIFLIIIIVGIFIISFNKINLYFIDPESQQIKFFNSRKELYSIGYHLANMHFPFGSGFASFGSDASTRILSPIYNNYNLLLPSGEISICATDAYFATILAQFGYIGMILFFCFWAYVVYIIYTLSLIKNNKKLFLIGISIVAYFLIESFSDSTFTQNRGLQMMMLLGLIISTLKQKKEAD